MEKIEFKTLYAEGNTTKGKLLFFNFDIDSFINGDIINYKLRVEDEDKNEIFLNFLTLEEAFSFLKNEVRKSLTSDEVLERYNQIYGNPNNTLDACKPVILSEGIILNAIIDYYGKGKNYSISAGKTLDIYGKKPLISFYIVEHVNYDGVTRHLKTRLTDGDLRNVINNYLKNSNYDLIDFEYVSGVHPSSEYMDEDIPYFVGIRLALKNKDSAQLKLRRR